MHQKMLAAQAAVREAARLMEDLSQDAHDADSRLASAVEVLRDMAYTFIEATDALSVYAQAVIVSTAIPLAKEANVKPNEAKTAATDEFFAAQAARPDDIAPAEAISPESPIGDYTRELQQEYDDQQQEGKL
jgi:hypothetical protein